MSIPIVAIVAGVESRDMGRAPLRCYPRKAYAIAGLEHGRAIPLPEMSGAAPQ
jgi:hypothetical protein